jgi:hypothetical protein
MQLDLFASGETPKLTEEETFICKKCGVEHPISHRYFTKDGRYLKSQDCKDCYIKAVKIRIDLHKTAPPKPAICDCCEKPTPEKGLYLDHCHDTGAFRGWLCNSCNVGIGNLGDNKEGLLKGIAYLERTSNGQP